MSTLLSTTAMVTECQSRVPIGLSSAFWMKKLNEAYRWISQKGAFVWELRYKQMMLNAFETSMTVPTDADPGKAMYLSGPVDSTGATQAAVSSLLPYLPWDEFLDQQASELTMQPGMFSCWSYHAEVTVGPPSVFQYVIRLTPSSAAPTVDTGAMLFTLMYHVDAASAELAVGADKYFQTPNIFDNLLIELAEAEARRIYGLAGWEIIQKRAESGIMPLLDTYRSTKNAVSGLIDQQKQTNERKLMAQERA